MRKLLALLCCVLLLPLAALAEEGDDPFDFSLLSAYDMFVYNDQNGVDIVYRFPDQPFEVQVDREDCEAMAYLDFVALAQEGYVAPRLVIGTELADETFGATELTLTVGKETWRFSVWPDVSEYDGMYYEDYNAPLTRETFDLMKALAKNKAGTVAFTLNQDDTMLLSGTIALPAETAAALRQLFLDCGGEGQLR